MIVLTLIASFLFGAKSYNAIIDGYTNKLSAFPGDSVELYLNAREKETDFNVGLYNLKGQQVAVFKMAVYPQQEALQNASENGSGYKRTGKIKIPNLKSGVYLFDNQIPFIVRSGNAQIVVLYPSNTNNAYCNSGGKSLYDFNSSDKQAAKKVSFHRPMPLPRHAEAFLRWMENQPYDNVGYITDIDLDHYNAIKNSSLLIIPGHSEYWTLQARKNFDRYVNDGKNALILSGNTMWWQVRYNKTKDQLICYRKAELDPIRNKKLKTINWNDETLSYPILQSIGVDFTLGGYGTKTDKGWNGYKIVSKSPLLKDTHLNLFDTIHFDSDEVDGAPILGFYNDLPQVNEVLLGFDKIEIVGYDKVWRAGKDGFATWIVFKSSKSSGTVINTASTNWCAYNGIGIDTNIQIITHNMIDKLMNNEDVFSPQEENHLGEAKAF